MAINLKQIAGERDLLAPGHRACAGCAGASILRMVTHAAGPNTVVGLATGCMEVVTTIYPYTAWRIPYIHNAFENVAATVSGVEAAYRSLKRKGKTDKEIKFIAIGGDGGTYDIGIQSLSGAMERGHNMLYICYDNEAYMNTGIQRSGATPFGAATSTTPAGKKIPGKQQHRKPLTEILIAHEIPYAAQAAPHNFMDLMRKVQKGLEIDGPAFINIMMPCPVGWRFPENLSMEMSRKATDACFWPLFEVENGEWKLNYNPEKSGKKIPIEEWIKPQGRYKHVFAPQNKHLIDEQQVWVDKRWGELKKKCGVE